jgi:hypothetical protein
VKQPRKTDVVVVVVVDVVEGRKEKVKEEESLSIYTQETPAK